MSAIVSGILNSTIGLLCSKVRDYTANKLNEGDVTDDQCRQIVVRELDDIKSKLDGLSRKDLLASLSFFKEGVTRLYISLEISGESCDEPSTSKAVMESDVEGATAATKVSKVDHLPVPQSERALERAFELAKVIGNFNIASQDRYKMAKESFKEAKRLATEAFNNGALRSEDRIMAGKLRIASRILEGLEDLDAAVRDCLLYLKELQDLPAMQAMFSVWRDSQKGITSRLRARFNKQKRNDNIKSIQLINALLLHLTMKFTKIAMALFDWPTIKIGNNNKTIYYPLFEDPALFFKIDTWDAPFIRQWEFDDTLSLYPVRCALTSKGEILSAASSRESLTITRKNGECDEFWLIPSGNNYAMIVCLAIDENDNVYVVISNEPLKLFILDANGNLKEERFLKTRKKQLVNAQMDVTKDGRIAMLTYSETLTMYSCDITNTTPEYEIPLPVPNQNVADQWSFTVSSKNEIIFTNWVTDDRQKLVSLSMYIITMDGKLKRSVQIPPPAGIVEEVFSMNVAYNHVNDTILVSFNLTFDSSNLTFVSLNLTFDKDCDNDCDNDIEHLSGLLMQTSVLIFSSIGDLFHQFSIPRAHDCLTSHPNGPIALVYEDFALMLQM